ncbi:MAG: pilus assembly protein [Alphaproteobacteria bacterium]|nr:pilus assembly protein [Alphaproteobacteria bacterium]
MKPVRAKWRHRGESGSAAIEFAFVAPVFFMFLFGIIEGGIMFFGQAALMNSVQDAARLIRTGQAQGSLDQTGFTQQICNGISGLLDCGNLQVDVQNYPTGFGTSQSSPTDSNGNLLSGQNRYNTGGPCDVVIVRAFYKYNIITPVLTPFLASNAGNNFNWLTASAAFRNEPYGTTTC